MEVRFLAGKLEESLKDEKVALAATDKCVHASIIQTRPFDARLEEVNGSAEEYNWFNE